MKVQKIDFPQEGDFSNVDMRFVEMEHEVSVYRNGEAVCITIFGLDFFKKLSGILFRFVEKRNEDDPINIVAIKNIEKLSNDEMVVFAKNIILKHKQRKYKWNYSARCFVFERNV